MYTGTTGKDGHGCTACGTAESGTILLCDVNDIEEKVRCGCNMGCSERKQGTGIITPRTKTDPEKRMLSETRRKPANLQSPTALLHKEIQYRSNTLKIHT